MRRLEWRGSALRAEWPEIVLSSTDPGGAVCFAPPRATRARRLSLGVLKAHVFVRRPVDRRLSACAPIWEKGRKRGAIAGNGSYVLCAPRHSEDVGRARGVCVSAERET